MENTMTQALVAQNFPIPSALGSIDAYVGAVNRIPVLTLEEEQALARSYLEQEDLAAARALVMSHLRFVVHVARGYNGYGLQLADLVQEGNIGLMKAVKRFEPDQGVRLVSFAVHWIRAEMHEFILRNWRIVKVATTKAQRKLFFNLRSMKQGLGALGTSEVKAIAKELGVKNEEVVEMETRLSGQDVSLEPVADDDEDRAYAPIAYLAADAAEPAALLEQQQTTQRRSAGLVEALNALDPRSRRIIEARWLNEKESATLHELAGEFGVSAERIRQIENKALSKMKGAMAAAA
jgi:RNA polymerase sigma-32 factor